MPLCDDFKCRGEKAEIRYSLETIINESHNCMEETVERLRLAFHALDRETPKTENAKYQIDLVLEDLQKILKTRRG